MTIQKVEKINTRFSLSIDIAFTLGLINSSGIENKTFVFFREFVVFMGNLYVELRESLPFLMGEEE